MHTGDCRGGHRAAALFLDAVGALFNHVAVGLFDVRRAQLDELHVTQKGLEVAVDVPAVAVGRGLAQLGATFEPCVEPLADRHPAVFDVRAGAQ
jgi:hypothetical protein